MVQTVRESGARILLVAMGAPRQEILLYRHRDELGAAVGLGVGGSFDVWAGTVKRAPAWTQRAKVEWLYRLAANPRRLRRQLVLPRYAAQVVRGSPDDYGPPRRGRAAARREREAPRQGSGARRPDDGRRRLRYLISGYYGEKNVGDEAILAGILQEIDRRDSAGALHRALVRPGRHRAAARRRPRPGGALHQPALPGPPAGCHESRRPAHQRRRQLPPRSRLRTARPLVPLPSRQAPAGAVLPLRGPDGPRRRACRSCGTRRDWGRSTPASARRLVAGAASASQAVTWRDPDSARLAYEVGVRAPVQLVVPDPAYALDPAPPEEAQAELSPLRSGARDPIPGRLSPALAGAHRLSGQSGGGVWRRLGTALDLEIVLVPFHEVQDPPVCETLAARPGFAGRARSSPR